MRVLVVGGLIGGFGALMLLGLLTMIRELFCGSMFETPFIADGNAASELLGHSAGSKPHPLIIDPSAKMTSQGDAQGIHSFRR